MFLLYLLTIISASTSNARADTFTIVGLFHEDNYQSEMAFKYALARHNMFNLDIQFEPKIHTISKTDTFAVQKLVCELVSADYGVVAIFGPESHVVSPMVESICTDLELPHLTTNYKPRISYTAQTAINLYPDPELLAMGVATVVKTMNWKSYMIIYQNNEDLVRLQEVLKISTPDSPPVTIRQLSDSDDHRPLLKELHLSTEFNFILDCDKELVIDILFQAKEVGMMKDFYNYLITNVDAHTLDFSVLEASANITVLRLIDPENPHLHNAVRDWQLGEQNNNYQSRVLSSGEVTAEAALMCDAVSFFAMTFREIHITGHIRSRPLSCEAPEPWQNGYRLATYMKEKHMPYGLTGYVQFNEYGMRSQFTLEVAEVIRGKINKTAIWTPENPDDLKFTRTESEQSQQIMQKLQEATVIVSSRIGPPYLMYRQPRFEGEILEGNNRYEGYSLDLIDSISHVINFTYKFELTADGAYGSYDPKKKAWNGLIRDLLERKAHLAICDLTITHQRREAVDFSLPFMTLGVSILYSKSKPSERNIFAFMDPLDTSVWIYIMSAYISVTMTMYLIARMAPGDWENPHPCDMSPEELENIWTLKNCLWLILGSTMSQGCDILPKGISSRMAASMWWFFILIISSSYTANLAAFLTMDKMAPSIDGAESLAKQTKIKYGAVNGGSTKTFFQESNYSTYARMWTQMEQARPSVFVENNEAGVKRVLTAKNQGYAFLMESSSLEYEVEKNCDLRQVGGRMDSKSYGIAMPVNSPYRSAINMAVLKLQEEGTLTVLKTRWWKEKQKNAPCDTSGDAGNSAELKLANVGGVFVVLAVGVSIAMIFAFLDFLWNAHVVSLEHKVSYKEAFMMEIQFAVKFWITQKKTNPTKSEVLEEDEEDQKAVEYLKKGSLGYNSIGSISNNANLN